jgi:hypothetical protein
MVGGKDEDSDNDDNAQPPQLKQPLPPDILFVSWWVLGEFFCGLGEI